MILILFVCLVALSCVNAATKKNPHGHTGVLEPYDGKPIPTKVTKDQSKKLDKNEPVLFTEQSGKSGRGVVIQDINATQAICLDKIMDLKMYPKMVPHVKKVDIYEKKKTFTGATKTGAEFQVGLLGMRFGYYLMLNHEPRHNTFTWTLDYRYNSDFDDNVGHWQVMPHPSKKGWTRLLYSCKIKLFPWIPNFIVNFLTSKALTESTSWVKREAEKEQAKQGTKASLPKIDLPNWMKVKGGAVAVKEKESLAQPFVPHMRLQMGKF